MTAKPRRLLLASALAIAAGSAHAADLMDAYEQARLSDPQLQFAEANAGAAEAGVGITRANLLPQIGGAASLEKNDGDSGGIDSIPNEDGTVSFGRVESTSDTTSRAYTARLDQSLYDHANWTSLRAAGARADEADFTYEAAADALMVRVAEAYFNVLTAIDTLVFSRAEERAVGRQLDQAEQRFEVGLTAITDVHEARARYDAARANAITAETALFDAREALAEITGEYLANLRGLTPEFDPTIPQPNDIEAWVSMALEMNPTLRASELALLAAAHDVSTARAGHLPSLSGFVSVGNFDTWGTRTANDVEFPARTFSQGPTVGVQLNVPIFSGFRVRSQVRQAIYTREANADLLEQDRRAITRQTRNVYRQLMAGISEIQARQQAVVSAQSALEATEAGFEVGTRTIVDVLLSQQVLFQAQRDYSTSRHNFLVNTLRLRQQAGTIEVADMQGVNALLTTDAEAPLQAPAPAETDAGLELQSPAGDGVPPIEDVDGQG